MSQKVSIPPSHRGSPPAKNGGVPKVQVEAPCLIAVSTYGATAKLSNHRLKPLHPSRLPDILSAHAAACAVWVRPSDPPNLLLDQFITSRYRLFAL